MVRRLCQGLCLRGFKARKYSTTATPSNLKEPFRFDPFELRHFRIFSLDEIYQAFINRATRACEHRSRNLRSSMQIDVKEVELLVVALTLSEFKPCTQ
jgi:hypothetical protein